MFMMSNPLADRRRAEQIERGVAVVTAEDNRWQRCDLKTMSLVGNVLMRQLAADAGAVETVMFRDGYLTEASASNVLVVIGGTIVAPPKDNLILPGITYGATLRIRARGRDPVRDAPGDASAEALGGRRDVAHRRRRRKCSRSPRSTASRSPAARPGRSSGGCTRSSRRTSPGTPLRRSRASRRRSHATALVERVGVACRSGRDGTRGLRRLPRAQVTTSPMNST